jgi:hypothetical protein
MLHVVVLVETEHHKSGVVVFHSVRYGGLNLLELVNLRKGTL